MFRHLRLSYDLLRLANSVLDRRKEKFKKELENLDLNERVLEDTLDCLIGIKDHLVRKMCVHWLKKKSIILPEDLPKVETAKDLIKGNRGIDYLTFDSPVEIIEQFEEKAQIEFDKLIKPDSLPELYDKVDLGEGVTVYTVENTKEGQYAVRKLADSYFGERFDNWCIIQRLRSEESDKRDKMGMHESAEEYWENYSEYPKRVAFKDGKLLAFCASDEREVIWWDRGNEGYNHIPGYKHLGDDDDFIRKYGISSGWFEKWKRGEADLDELFRDGKIPEDELWGLIKHPSVDLRMELVQIFGLPEGILAEMLNDEDSKVRRNIAGSTKLIDVLVKLSDDEDGDVRSSVAKNPNTPSDILEKLSSDKDYRIRYGVAGNLNTSTKVLVKLSDDENPLVRKAIAARIKEVDILSKLSKDGYGLVRNAVAENSGTPIDVLVKLSSDEDSEVRSSVAKSYKLPKHVLVKLSKDKKSAVRENIAYNLDGYTPTEVFTNLSVDDDIEVRCILAESFVAPPYILIKLSSDKSQEVRQSVAQNHNTPDEILEKLSKDAVDKVKNTAIRKLEERREQEQEYNDIF